MNEFDYDDCLASLVGALGPERVEEIRKEIYAKIPPHDKARQLRENWLYNRLLERLPPLTLVDFVTLPLPRFWHRWTIEKRQRWWNGIEVPKELMETLIKRDRVCAVEIWCELYGKPRSTFNQTCAREINKDLSRIPGLVRMRSGGLFGPYGAQRGFYCNIRPENENTSLKQW